MLEFHNYETVYLWAKRNRSKVMRQYDLSTPEKFYKVNSNIQWHDGVSDGSRHNIMSGEFCWYTDGCPYYKFWPHIIKHLTKIPLDMKLSDLRMPYTSMLLRFAKGKQSIVGPGGEITTILVGRTEIADPRTMNIVGVGLRIYMKTVEGTSFEALLPGSDHTLEETIKRGWFSGVIEEDSLKGWSEENIEIVAQCARLVVSLGLMEHCEELIEPEILQRHKKQFEITGDEHYIEKSRKYGLWYDVGREDAERETSPHYRRPHPFLAWTGQGKKVPKIVLRKGHFVHRDKITEVPTGFQKENE